MDVTPLISKEHKVIQSYTNGKFKISNEIYAQAVIVRTDNVIVWDIDEGVGVSDLKGEDFSALTQDADNIDVVLLGCGSSMTFLPPKLRNELKEHGLSVDIMDTGAACRTYNVLMAEGRRVACALLPT